MAAARENELRLLAYYIHIYYCVFIIHNFGFIRGQFYIECSKKSYLSNLVKFGYKIKNNQQDL